MMVGGGEELKKKTMPRFSSPKAHMDPKNDGLYK